MAEHFVTSTGAGAHTGADVANAWTLQEAFNATASAVGGRSVATHDVVYCCADATYLPTVTLDTAANMRVFFVGANASGVVDGTRFVVSAASLGTSTDSLFAPAHNWHTFDGLDFVGNGDGVVVDFGIGANDCRFRNFSVSGGTVGMSCISRVVTLGDGEFFGNTSHGLELVGRSSKIKRVSAHDNGGEGIRITTPHVCLSDLVLYDNTSHGLSIGSGSHVSKATIYGNGDDGVHIGNADGGVVLSDLAIVGNTGYGIGVVNSAAGYLARRCYFESNTAGTMETSAGTAIETITAGSIGFTSVTDGSEDFTPGSSSPVLDVGTPLPFTANAATTSTIGAIDYKPTGGSSGPSGSPLSSPFIRV